MNCPNCKKDFNYVFTVSEFTQKQLVEGDTFLEEYEDVNDAIGDSKYKLCPHCSSFIEGKSHSFLEAQVDRLLKAQGGWGMVSELDSLEEARVLVQGLYDRVEAYNKPQSQCGHKIRYVVTSDEGTSFCLMCAFEEVQHMMTRRDDILNKIHRLALLPADGYELKDGESDDPMSLLIQISLLSNIGNRSRGQV